MNTITTNSSVLDNPFVRFELKDGILFVEYKQGITITLEKAKEIVKQRREFTSNNSYPMMISDEGLVSVDKDARDYYSNEGTEGIIAGAFILKSVYSSFFFNFYLRITNPKIPSRTFTEERKALEWLQQYKNVSSRNKTA